jgi:hypothetical protein
MIRTRKTGTRPSLIKLRMFGIVKILELTSFPVLASTMVESIDSRRADRIQK